MKIQVLGVGCPKCKTLLSNVEEAAKEMNLEVEIEKVVDLQEIVSFGVMSTPGLAINGKVVSAGKLLSVQQVKDLLATAQTRG